MRSTLRRRSTSSVLARRSPVQLTPTPICSKLGPAWKLLRSTSTVSHKLVRSPSAIRYKLLRSSAAICYELLRSPAAVCYELLGSPATICYELLRSAGELFGSRAVLVGSCSVCLFGRVVIAVGGPARERLPPIGAGGGGFRWGTDGVPLLGTADGFGFVCIIAKRKIYYKIIKT